MKTTTLDHKLASIKDSYESFKQVHESLTDLTSKVLHSPVSFTWDIWEITQYIRDSEQKWSKSEIADFIEDIVTKTEITDESGESEQLSDELDYEIRTYSYTVLVPIGSRTAEPNPAPSAENILKKIRMGIPTESTKSNSQATGSDLDTSKLKQMLAGLDK